jgi:ribosome-binding protein aMBF1 (putative translation factor)
MASNQRNRYNTPSEQEAPDCQDWTPVTIGKAKAKAKTATGTGTGTGHPPQTFAAITAMKNSASAVVAATSASASASGSGGGDDTTKKTKYIAKVTSDAVRNARCEKKLTQKELAQKCNMDVSIIAEIERGGNCVYNPTPVNKIQSVLGVKIPRA